MANDEPMSKWRNFAAWSAAGAIFYFLAIWGVSSFLYEDGMGAMVRSREVAATVVLALLLAMGMLGLSNRNRPISVRRIRNFVILSTVVLAVSLLAISGFAALDGSGALGAMGASEWAAAVTGAILVSFAFLGALVTASARTGANLIDDEVAAEELRERGRLFAYSFVWMAACGLLLIVLGLAGSAGVLSQAAALAGALALIAVQIVLGIVTWRLSDELGRTLSHETGNMAFYLIIVLGGGWAMLAHIGFVAAPAPLDWLTLFTVLLFVASVIVVGRRGMLKQT